MTIPAPPSQLGNCKLCRHYCASELQTFIMAPQGPIPLKSIPPSERVGVANMKRMEAAPCTFLPNWALQPPDGWCWQWVKTLEANGGKRE